jgi:hypothetical protein
LNALRFARTIENGLRFLTARCEGQVVLQEVAIEEADRFGLGVASPAFVRGGAESTGRRKDSLDMTVYEKRIK